MLEVGGAKLEREEIENGHQSKMLVFLASPLLLKAVELLRKKGLDIDE